MALQSHAPLTILQFYNLRPDLLDWRQVERRDVRERIDLAFHIMDREYGVTRLLDPEGELSSFHSMENRQRQSTKFVIYRSLNVLLNRLSF